MSAFRQAHAQNSVARLQQGKVHRHIRLRSGMGLDVGVLCAEQLFGPFNRQGFHHVDGLAAAVIPFARVPLRVFVGEDRAHGRHNRRGDNVLRGNQLQVAPLAFQLLHHRLPYLRVLLGHKADGIHHILIHGIHFLFSYFQIGRFHSAKYPYPAKV